MPSRVPPPARPKSPSPGAAFNFWHPKLVTMHVWTWYPNPAACTRA